MIDVKNLIKTYKSQGKRKIIFKKLNFTIKDGESVAFLGRNGTGKSTLIRILAGCESYDSGFIKTNQSISWPIALQGGFQGSLTGRENIVFICKLFHGNKEDVIRSKIRFVKKFADIGPYFDMSYNLYSSGMRSRLAFGLSMAFKFDIYLLDEVTAVGDIEFKKKCKIAIEKKLKENSSFISVSNSISALDYVKKVFIIDNGNIKEFNNPKEGYDTYMKMRQIKIK